MNAMQFPAMRRRLLSGLARVPLFAIAAAAQTDTKKSAQKPLKIMMKSAWGPDDPTRAAFPFSHGLALAEAGHDVRMFSLPRPRL